MSAGNWLRVIMVAAGVFLLWMTLASLAKRKFTDGFSVLWGLLSVCMILAGVLLEPQGISSYISNTGIVIVCVAGAGLLFMFWCFSREISNLVRKNHELAMQLSLLNQENYQIQRLLEQITNTDGSELWR